MEHAAASIAPIAADVQETLETALSQTGTIREVVEDAARNDLRDVFFVGCGGSLYAAYPAQFTLDSRSAATSSFAMTSSEFIYRAAPRLGKHSLVVLGSHSGRTPETLEALRTAEATGASVAVITATSTSPLAEAAPSAFTYESSTTVWPPKQILFLQFAYAVLDVVDGIGSDPAQAGLAALSDALVPTISGQDRSLAAIAGQFKDEPITYVVAAGPNYGAASAFSMCYLQEMQWMHSAAINAGEFLHGALEVVTEDTPMIMLLGEDATRPMTQRALDFARRFSTKAVVIDSMACPLSELDALERSEVAPIVLGALTTRLAQHYAAIRNHPLDQRRYMDRVSY